MFLGWHLPPGGKWAGDYLVVYMPDLQAGSSACGDTALPRGRVHIYRSKAIIFDKDAPFHFPMAKAYDAAKWNVELTPTVRTAPPADEPLPDDVPGVRMEEDTLPGGAEEKVTRETGSPLPHDQHPEVDYPFVFHGRSWFKGPYEILPDDTWV